MFCTKCGNKLEEDDLVCSRCGAATTRRQPEADIQEAESADDPAEKTEMLEQTEQTEQTESVGRYEQTDQNRQTDQGTQADQELQKPGMSRAVIILLVLLGAAVIGVAALIGISLKSSSQPGKNEAAPAAAETTQETLGTLSTEEESAEADALETAANEPIQPADNPTEEIVKLNSDGNSIISVDVFAENYTPGARNPNFAWDKKLFYSLEDVDPNSGADGKIYGYNVSRKLLKNAATGNKMEYEIYTNPSTGKVNKIVSIEYLQDYLEITDFYYDDNGRASFIFIRNDVNYIPSYAVPTKDGQRFYYNSDCMVKWRVVNGGVQSNYVVGPEAAAQNEVRDGVFRYDTLDAGAKANYDLTEKRMANAAYNTYNTVINAKGVSEIVGYVYDENGTPLSGAGVTLYTEGNNEKLYQCTTDETGLYEIIVPSEDEKYRLTVESSDCVTTNLYGVGVSDQMLSDYQDTVYMVKKADTAYPVKVQMYDVLNYAADGNGMDRLGNSAIYIREGVNHRDGGVVAQATADETGIVDMTLLPGMYTAEVVKPGYDSTYYNFAAKDQMDTVQIGSSPKLAEGEVRVVLTWGAYPNDLDSHLFTPYDSVFGDTTYHIWYGNKQDVVGNNLDVDDTDSFGPETMTVPMLKDGLYKYYVADFTECSRGDTTSFIMSNSGATVNVYTSDGLTSTFHVPANTSGVIWEVFEIRNGAIVPIQRYYSNIDDKSWWHNDK